MPNIAPKLYTTPQGKSYTLRAATEADVPGFLEHLRQVTAEREFLLTVPEELPQTDEQAKAWKERLFAHGSMALVAEAQNQIVGELGFHRYGQRQRSQHVGWIGLSVLKEFRGMGIGSTLLATALDWAAAEPTIEKVGLGVFASNLAAIALYKKFGFSEEGRRIREYRLEADRYEDEIMMYRFVK